MTEPLNISIITVVYNRETTVGQAIASVAVQDYSHVEHVIVDGASTDGTLAMIERHRHSRMNVLSEPDRGVYDAINKGIARATGDVIGVVHSDDYLAHDKVLSTVAAAFVQCNVDGVYGDLDYVAAEDTSQIIRHWRAGEFRPERLRWGWMPPHPTLFLRREVFERFGVYDTRYRISGDYDAILRWFGRGSINVAYIPGVLVKMRVGGESNRSLGHIMLKSCEDYRALRSNSIGGIKALAFKNLGKLGQFIVREKRDDKTCPHH